ncbi:MAG: hypothetical protein V6Z89_01250 [Desulfobacter sp.]
MNINIFASVMTCLIAVSFILFPGHIVKAQVDQDATAAKKNMGKSLPPIDQATPTVFETASFGLG